MIGSADGAQRRTRNGAKRRGSQNVIQPPPNVPLLHIPPRRPPREVILVGGVQGTPHIHQPLRDEPLEQRALFRQLADRARLALFRMHVHVRARDVHVAAEDQVQAALAERRGVCRQRMNERDLRLEVFSAIRNVHAGEHCVPDLGLYDPRFVIELRMLELHVLRESGPDVQGHARAAARAVPVARISFARTGLRDLFGLRLDLLQADHIGLFAAHELHELLVPRADSVHVPGGNLHGPRIVIAGTTSSGGQMRKAAFLLFLLLIPTSLFAQYTRGRGRYRDTPRDNAVELTPFLGYRYGGTLYADQSDLFRDDVDLKSSADVGAFLGLPLGDTGLKIELLVSHQQTELEPGGGLFNPSNPVGDID